MPEALCNNPKARVTSRGLNPSRPCGIFEEYGIGWCSKKDYDDWLNLYKNVITAADKQFLYLKQIRLKVGKLGHTPEEVFASTDIEMAKLEYSNLQEQALSEKKQSSSVYQKRISDLDAKIASLTCLIENVIQSSLEELGAPPKPTGLIEGSRESNLGKYLVYGVIGIGAIWAFKNN